MCGRFFFTERQRIANMACSRSFAVCFLITLMFMFLLICHISPKAAIGYDLLLYTVFYNSNYTIKDSFMSYCDCQEPNSEYSKKYWSKKFKCINFRFYWKVANEN